MATTDTSSFRPGQNCQFSIEDVPYREDEREPILARVYRPEGPGPFHAVIDIHGGVWTGGDRKQNELMDRALAADGLVVIALDFRVAPAHPYPAQIQDVNYGIRWAKAHAAQLNIVPDTLGGLGTSSGGHTLMLAIMRPHDPRYAALPLPEAPDIEATVAYGLNLWAVLDPYVRYLYARTPEAPQHLVKSTEGYFPTEEAMLEGNPQRVLERGEAEELPPILIVQPIPDRNVPKEIPERFFAAYRAAGGYAELETFPGAQHGFAREASSETERALEVMRSFIARQLGAVPVSG